MQQKTNQHLQANQNREYKSIQQLSGYIISNQESTYANSQTVVRDF